MKFVKIFAAGLCLFSAVVVSLKRTEDIPNKLREIKCTWKLIGQDCKSKGKTVTKCDRKTDRCKRLEGQNCLIREDYDECLDGSFCKPYDKDEKIPTFGTCAEDSFSTSMKKAAVAIGNVGSKAVAGVKDAVKAAGDTAKKAAEAAGDAAKKAAKAVVDTAKNAGDSIVKTINGVAYKGGKVVDKILAPKEK